MIHLSKRKTCPNERGHLIPFWAMLVGIGTIIAVADPLIFWTIVFAAAVGAALGDWLSYWLGYHYHGQIQQMWPLKNHPKLLDKARLFFRRWGAWGIVIARFSGPLRASVALTRFLGDEVVELLLRLGHLAQASCTGDHLVVTDYRRRKESAGADS